MLTQQDSLDEAFLFAESHQLNPVFVYRRQLQYILRQWRENHSSDDWLTSPAVDCEAVLQILRKAPSDLIFYVLSSEYIPSLATTSRLIQFGRQYVTGDDSVRMNVITLKWSLFLQLLYNEDHVTAQTWQVGFLSSFQCSDSAKCLFWTCKITFCDMEMQKLSCFYGTSFLQQKLLVLLFSGSLKYLNCGKDPWNPLFVV